MDVEVIVEKWGSYKKGDVIPDMPESTALACITKGVVKEFGTEDPEPPISAEEQAKLDEAAEADRLEKERLEQEELEKVRLENERLAKEEADRLEKDKAVPVKKEELIESKPIKKQ